MSQSISFVVVSTDLESFKGLRGALAADGRARLLAGGDDADQLTDEVIRMQPSAAVIMLGPAPEARLALVERLAAECPRTAIICASRDASPDLILKGFRAGAREFLRLPIIPAEFQTVMDRIADLLAGQVEVPKKRGRVVAVFSSKGGCGTSFIATNLAAALDAPSVLVDLNLQAGDLSLFLGLEPKFSIADLIENRERVDDSLLNSYLTPHSPRLSLLAAPA